MSVTTNQALSQSQIAPLSKLWWVGLVAIGGAVVANLIFFVVSRAMGISYLIPLQGPGSPFEPLPAAAVAMATIIPGLAAVVVFAALGKFLTNPLRVFWIISGLFLLVSFAGPIMTLPAEVSMVTKTALNVMHVIAGAVIVGVLSTLGRSR